MKKFEIECFFNAYSSINETIKQRYGKEVSLSSVSSIFDVKKL